MIIRVKNSFIITFSKTYKKDKQNAIAYALQNNIEMIIPQKNGGVSILEKVLKDGTLIYVSTLMPVLQKL